MARPNQSKILNFNINDYINPHLRRAPLQRLPRPISHFLGHRSSDQPPLPNLLVWFWAFIGAFAGLLTVEAISKYGPGLAKWHPPIVIASLGASAILQYNVIASPLAQPRNLVLGQTLSAITGVCITKLFRLNSDFDNLAWVAGALACGTASAVMGITDTVYPPAGATAVLAATNSEVLNMGWLYILFVLLDSLILGAVALLINNVQRQWPLWWWTPQDLSPRKSAYSDHEKKQSAEQNIVIASSALSLPEHLDLSDEERTLLRSLQKKLANLPSTKDDV